MKRNRLAAMTVLATLIGTASAAETLSNRFAGTSYPGAEAASKMLLQPDLNEKEVSFWFGRLAERHDDLETAVDTLEDIVDDKPDNVIALLRFAQASCMLAGHPDTGMLSKAGLAGDCRDSYEKVTQLDPKQLPAWQGLFDFYRMAPGIVGGGVDKAEKVIGKIAALDPAEGELAQASLALQQEQIAAMRDHFNKAASLNPAKADKYRRQEALALMNAEQFPAAYELLLKLRDSNDDPAQVQYQLGRIAVLAKQADWYVDAEQQLQAYLARTDLTSEHPTKAWASFRLGQLYELMGKAEQAKASFQAAARQQPDDRLKGELKKKAIKV
ncbi:hypothetical protein HPT27_01715 [Permianibacter sp. IMCC34836]|uniref:tetratricopeptide repeat protein n=1 Tax=Permianibacter fluminis TaxID=2738515 RepID=UPI0015520EC1|nr:tetratricopeptide repeat protein [Permianibacter fluminis]NQD35719.1 hypothetical protein [Permianibacter fluminis]